MSIPLVQLTATLGLGLATGLLPAAEGSRLLGSGTAQLATAGAGAASPWDSTWLINNAAGLTRVPHRIDGAVELIYAESTLTPRGGLANPDAGTLSDDTVVVAPHLTYARPLADGAGVLGFGFYTVSGLEAEFDKSRSAPGAAGDYDSFARIGSTRLSAAYARELPGGWSIGLALNLNHTQFEADLMTADGSQTEGEGDADQALGAGFQLAVHKEFEDVAVALVYTSRQWMQSLDKYRDLLAGPLDQPQVLQFGVAWRVSPQLELLADYRYIDWSSVTAIGSKSSGFGWEDQHVFKLATRWRAAPTLTVHAGVSYGRSPIRSDSAFINGFSMLNSEWHFATGATWMATERLELGAALMHAPENRTTDDGSRISGLGEDTEITLEMTSLTLSLGYLL